MKKEKKILTFKSWENSCEKGTRAIALCDATNWFAEAINCVRDSNVNTKDERGVYTQHWVADNVRDDELGSIRPATEEEIDLYLDYVTMEDALKFGNGVKKVDVDWKHTSIKDGYVTIILTDLHLPWWKKLWNFYYKH